MALESGTFIQDLQQTNPPGTDKKKQGDDHLRLIKSVLKNTFPNGTRAQYFARSRAVAASGNITATDMAAAISADATAGVVSLALPTLAAGDDGYVVTVVKADASANNVTMTGTVNGISGFSLTRQFEAGMFIWGGSAWFGVRFRPFIVTGDIQDNSITNVKMADAAIGTAELIDANVTNVKLADNSVTTAKIQDGQVTNPKLVGPRMTQQTLLSGTAQTYTTPANCKGLKVYYIGGGGGGGGSGGNGGTGGTTTFNGIDAAGGVFGLGSGNFDGGAGGSGGAGAATLRIAGGDGCNVCDVNRGPSGGNGAFGGGGKGGNNGVVAGSAGKPNSGGGGGAYFSGGGGGAGEYVELVISSPAATYIYTVGAGGTAGSGGTNGGGAGGSGVIIVEEYY